MKTCKICKVLVALDESSEKIRTDIFKDPEDTGEWINDIHNDLNQLRHWLAKAKRDLIMYERKRELDLDDYLKIHDLISTVERSCNQIEDWCPSVSAPEWSYRKYPDEWAIRVFQEFVADECPTGFNQWADLAWRVSSPYRQTLIIHGHIPARGPRATFYQKYPEEFYMF